MSSWWIWAMAAKVRPCWWFRQPIDSQRNMSVVVPMTTEIRGGDVKSLFQTGLAAAGIRRERAGHRRWTNARSSGAYLIYR